MSNTPTSLKRFGHYDRERDVYVFSSEQMSRIDQEFRARFPMDVSAARFMGDAIDLRTERDKLREENAIWSKNLDALHASFMQSVSDGKSVADRLIRTDRQLHELRAKVREYHLNGKKRSAKEWRKLSDELLALCNGETK